MEVPILKIPFDESDADFIGRELRQMLLSGNLAMGRHVRDFEEAFARFCGVPQALGCSNGTAALEMICRALKVTGGSVAVPANTFMATALAPLAAGAKIVLVDCDPHYFQMCPDDLEAKIRPDTKAVLLVHLGGFISPALERIKVITEKNGARLIEDAAHAHGAQTSASRAGGLGLAGAFSFYPTKVLTSAEGGMITTRDPALYEELSALRQHGQARPGSNIHQSFGLNYRPSELHALLGLAMMKKADWILEERRRAAAIYDQLLINTSLTLVRPPAGQKPAYYKYMALLPSGTDRERLKQRLKREFQISLAGEVYSRPLHLQPFWSTHPQSLAAPVVPLPVSKMIAERQICLPLYPGLSREAQEYVAEKLLTLID